MKRQKGFVKCLTAAVMVSMVVPFQISNTHALAGWLTESDLTSQGTVAPVAYGPVPDAMQYQYQKQELAAFCHFGPNTFNEIEWGENYGNTPPSEIFKLSADDQFDADTLVTSLKNAGFKRLIVTAKHHDGFCIWNSQYTDYDVANTNYKNGNGDILAEISKACTEQDMDMGLYLSPWDIHDKSYGYFDKDGNPLVDNNKQPINGMTWEEVEEKDVYDYNEYYNNQLEEILGNDKYGNHGKFVEIWMDGAKGEGYKTQNYKFDDWFSTIQKNEGKEAGRPADCLLFGSGAKTTVRWIGNENGIAPETNWSQCRMVYKDGVPIDVNTGWDEKTGLSAGYQDGDVWTVPECDSRITDGWFWGTNKKIPKSMEELANMYFSSVGRNATLLLNVPPNNKGKIDQAIVDRIAEFGKAIKDTFQTNKAKNKTVYADTVLGHDSAYSPNNVIDGNQDTYWTTNGQNKGSLVVDLEEKTKFDVVSIEEAIQKGQRIEKYSVEYSNDAINWEILDEGTTIGSKRLIRKNAISAQYVRITVETPNNTVPLISEVGIFKATGGFELSMNIPDGMDIIDISDTDVSDGIGFTQLSRGWNQEVGDKYLEQTNMWATSGETFDIKFKGTKIYLIGSQANNNGTASISIDGQPAVEVDSYKDTAQPITGVRLFTSEDLTDGEHTLSLTTNGIYGVEGALVINNGGKGMFEFENTAYRVDEAISVENTLEHKLKIKRVGGTNGVASVTVGNNPGTAMQGNYDATNSGGIVSFSEGESEKDVSLFTKYDSRIQGDTTFTMNLTSAENAIVGFDKEAIITITDRDTKTKAELQALINEHEIKKQQEHLYKGGWDNFITALNEAEELITKSDLTDVQSGQAYRGIKVAVESLVKRTNYTEADCFVFPVRPEEEKIAEIEFGSLENVSQTPDNENSWSIQINDKNWASNGKVVNCIHEKDTIKIPYYADKTGTYKVTLTYGNSGSLENGIYISESDGKIEQTSLIAAGSEDPSQTNLTVEFEIQVKSSGAGILIITGGEKGASGLDKLTLMPQNLNYEQYTITSEVEGYGTVQTTSGEGNIFNEYSDVEFTITPHNGYKIKDILVNGESVGAVSNYTFKDIHKNASIRAIFEFVYYNVTEPFELPGEIGEENKRVLEAELTELLNTGGDSEEWKLCVEGDKDWASQGKVVNCFNKDDTLTVYYNAPKTGEYQFVATYRSGSPTNKLVWSGENVDSGEIVAGASSADATHTVQFTVNVKKAGAGKLVFTAPDTNSPILDKFDVSYYGDELTRSKYSLNEVIKTASEEVMKIDVYKPSSITALTEAITNAKHVYNNSQEVSEVNQAKDTLQNVLDHLELKVQKEELKNILDKAKLIVDHINMYSPNSIIGLEENYQEALGLYNDENATQENINASVAKLKVSVDNAQKRADINDLQNQVIEAQQIDLKGYTEASVKVFKLVLRDAQNLLSQDLTFKNQAEVDLLSSRLFKAKKLLTLKSELEKDEVIDLSKPDDKPEQPEYPTQPEQPDIPDKPIDNVVLTSSNQEVTVFGKLPKNTKLSVSILNEAEKTEIIKNIQKMNPDFFKTAKLEKVYDLSLMLKNQKYNLDGLVDVVFKLDKELLGKNIGIIYIDDQGNIKKIPSVIDGEYIQFRVSHFSKYAIVSYNNKDTGISIPGKVDIPNTGDNELLNIYITMGIISMTMIYLILKKKKKEEVI